MEKEAFILSVLVGTSHIQTAYVNIGNGVTVDKSMTKYRVDAWAGREQIIDSLVTSIQNSLLETPGSVAGVGIAMPGPFADPVGESQSIPGHKFGSLRGLDIRQIIAEKLHTSVGQIRVLNDASAFLQGEVINGNGRDQDCVIALTIGSGLGSSLYANGRLEDTDLWRSGFLNGTAEEYLSRSWFLKRYYELTGINMISVSYLSELTSESAAARQVFREFGINLGNLIEELVRRSQPQVIVLGGSILDHSNQFLKVLRSYLQKKQINIPVKVSGLRGKAALSGLRSLWLTDSNAALWA